MNREFKSFGALAKHFERVSARLPAAEHHALEVIGKRVEERAASKIGNEQAGWPALAESTIADKERAGYPVPAPLLRTGYMRATIEHEVIGNDEVDIGSPDPVALWQELGTSKGIPPRSFLGSSMIDTMAANAGTVLQAVIRAFRGR